MTDIGHLAHIQRPATQLPVSAYFDESLYQHELHTLFSNGPGYRGHRLMVPEPGDYRTLVAEQEGRVLVNQRPDEHNPNGRIELLSNVCRHRQAIMLNGAGNADSIVCPLHRWTYDLDGSLKGAPHFDQQPCLELPRYPLQEWQGLLFESPRDIQADLRGMSVAADLDFSGYRLDHVEVHECNYNWKTFIEVYLEDYHVVPFHPGLGHFVDCNQLRWEFGEWYSVQTVGLHRDLQKPGTPVYRKWHDEVLRFNGGKMPKYGAIWLTYYPNLMVEWYPNSLVISSLIRADQARPPTSSSSTTPKRSSGSSASSSRPSAPPTWKPPSRMTRSASAWTPAAGPCSSAAKTRPAPTRARWKTACSTSTSSCAASWATWATRRTCRPTTPLATS